MKVVLKKIRVYDRMSEETTAFVAEVHINGHNVGDAKNDGRGGETELQFYHEKDSPLRKLCNEAEAWAKNLPDRVIEMRGEKSFSMKRNLVDVIDEQVEDYLKKKEEAALEKKWKKGFAFGVPNAYNYRFLPLPKGHTFETLLATKNLPVQHSIQNKINAIKATLKPDEVFLNAKYLQSLGFTV